VLIYFVNDFIKNIIFLCPLAIIGNFTFLKKFNKNLEFRKFIRYKVTLSFMEKFMIRTTINISDKTLEKLKNATSKLDVPIENIIKLVMTIIHRDNKSDDRYVKLFSRIEYQGRDSEIIWSCMHITLTPQEYEHFIDMRKMFKMSVSHIIAFAVLKYLKILLKKYYKTIFEDKNHQIYFSIYNFYIDFYKGVKSYIISSEMPQESP
jgi:hypothetical protein